MGLWVRGVVFSKKFQLTVSLFALLVANAIVAQTARMEIHSFDTVTLSDKEFLTGVNDSKPVRIGGELRLPVGAGPFPAVLLVHGSAGAGANVDRWAQEFNSIGMAAFVMDSFTGRGITTTIDDQSRVGNLAMIMDAYRALALLAKHPRIDSKRIAVMGFSKGGFVALYASMKRFQRMHAPAGVEFAAYIPFYPSCFRSYIDDTQVSDRPIRMFQGSADDWVGIAPCREYVGRLRAAGKDAQLIEYEGAAHTFDNPLLTSRRNFPDAQNQSACWWVEKSPGEMVDRQTGQPFSWTNPCVKRGASAMYDPGAYAAAVKAVKEFLSATFNLGQSLKVGP